MGVNLEKELLKDKEGRLKKSSDERTAVDEVKLLLAGEDQEDQRILRFMGGNSAVMQLENFKGENIEWEKLEKEYGKVFSRDQIRDLAIDYRLRFLNSNLFIGSMNVEVTAKIKEFAKDINTVMDEHTLLTRFFILAVPSCFSLQKVKAKRFSEWEERKRQAQLDPVLFYKIDDNHYRMIHQWGKEFTLYRKLLGYRWKTPNTLRTSSFFMALPVVALLMAAIFPDFIWTHMSTAIFAVTGFSFLFATLFNVIALKEGGFFVEDKTVYNPNYFTPTNWDSNQITVG